MICGIIDRVAAQMLVLAAVSQVVRMSSRCSMDVEATVVIFEERRFSLTRLHGVVFIRAAETCR